MVRTDAKFSHASAHVICALDLSNVHFQNRWPRRRPPALDVTSFMRLLGLSDLQPPNTVVRLQ